MSNVFLVPPLSKTFNDPLSLATILTPAKLAQFHRTFKPRSVIKVGDKTIFPFLWPDGFKLDKLDDPVGAGLIHAPYGDLFTGFSSAKFFHDFLLLFYTKAQLTEVAWRPTKAQTKRLVAFYTYGGGK